MRRARHKAHLAAVAEPAATLSLLQVGEFYEAAGVDAVVLVQHANLNAMAPGSGVARAGMPIGALQKKLDLLVKQLGFSVVSADEHVHFTGFMAALCPEHPAVRVIRCNQCAAMCSITATSTWQQATHSSSKRT